MYLIACCVCEWRWYSYIYENNGFNEPSAIDVGTVLRREPWAWETHPVLEVPEGHSEAVLWLENHDSICFAPWVTCLLANFLSEQEKVLKTICESTPPKTVVSVAGKVFMSSPVQHGLHEQDLMVERLNVRGHVKAKCWFCSRGIFSMCKTSAPVVVGMTVCINCGVQIGGKKQPLEVLGTVTDINCNDENNISCFDLRSEGSKV